MDQIVFLGMGETGADIVTTVADSAKARKQRINEGGRICCAHVYEEQECLKEVTNIISCSCRSIGNVFDALEDSTENVSAIIVAALSEADKELCLKTAQSIRAHYANKNRSVKVKGIFLLPDTGLFSQIKDAFDTVWFISDMTEGGKVNVSKEHLLFSVGNNIYTRYFSLLAEKFDAQEKEAEFNTENKPLIGTIGYSKVQYPVDSVAEYCAYRCGCEIIDRLNLSIDREIYASAESLPLMRDDFRREYVKLFEEKIEDDPNGLFPQIKPYLMNKTVTLNEVGEEEYSYSDKVEDFLLITENMTKVFAEDRAAIKLKTFEGTAEDLICELNALSVEIANELLVNALPCSISRINQKNDGSVFGMISYEGGDIPEDRVFLHPVAARYLIYKLALKLVDIRNSTDLSVENEAIVNAFGAEDKKATVESYLDKAVLISFAKVFGDRLERLISEVEKYFASLWEVYKHFSDEIEKTGDSISDDPALIFVSGSRSAKEEIFRNRIISIDGNNPFMPTVCKLLVAQYCLGEDPFDKANRIFTGRYPGYSFEYNASVSYKKLYMRSKDPKISVSNDLYTLCGTDDAFKALVDDVRKAATPVGASSDIKYVWPVSSVLASRCSSLGEILGCDVEKSIVRGAEQYALECFSTDYGADISLNK